MSDDERDRDDHDLKDEPALSASPDDSSPDSKGHFIHSGLESLFGIPGLDGEDKSGPEGVQGEGLPGDSEGIFPSDDPELQALLGSFPDADADEEDEEKPEPPPKKPRYRCGGSKRTDEWGNKYCTYKAIYRWLGPCPGDPTRMLGLARKEALAAVAAGKGCGQWFNCLEIKKGEKSVASTTTAASAANRKPPVYYKSGVPEFDKVIGGGLRLGRTLLLGGSQGAGKSSLCFQIADGFAQEGRKAYYASGEMDEDQNLEYLGRLGIANPNLILYSNLQGIQIESLCDTVIRRKAQLVIIDSLKNCECESKGSLGTAQMMDDVIEVLISFAKIKQVSIIVISHLSKEGDYSGSRKVQFLVDGLVHFDSRANYERVGESVMVAKDGMEGLREIYMDAKNRQGKAGVTSLVELYEEERNGVLPGIRSPSSEALRAYAKHNAGVRLVT